MSAYREPKRSRAAADHGLVAAMMRAPTTAAVRPEENQFSEALAWALRRVPDLARDFALLFVRGDAAAEQAILAADEIGVDTRITVRGPSDEVLYPDLSLCGADRVFQLFVEVKVGAGFQEYPMPDGSRASQPVIYAHALERDPPSSGALLRRVGTLSKDPGAAPQDPHPLRRRDVSWAEVRDLLKAAPAAPGVFVVVAELVEAINVRILPTPPAAEQAKELLAWGRTLLPGVLNGLAAVVRGTTTGGIRPGTTHPYVGGFVNYTNPEGMPLRMWVYVSPEGAGYSVPGELASVCVQPDQESKADEELQGRLALGFQWDRDIAGWDAWRAWIPVDEVRAAGDRSAQEALVIEAFKEAFSAAGLD